VSETARVVKAESCEKWIDVGLKEEKQAWYPGAALEASAVNKGKKGKHEVSSKAASEDKLWYPAVVDLVKVHRHDPECIAIFQQLELLKDGGIPALKLAGVGKERMRYLQLHEIDAAGQLRCVEVIVHVYGCDGKLPAEKGMCQAQWEMDKIVNETQPEEGTDQEQWACDFDRTASRVVVPKELRDGILFLHHHSRMASHASWVDMVDSVQAAGYTWKGLGNSCKQTTKRCMDWMKAKRPHSKSAGLLSSRRYKRPFDSLSCDMQDLGREEGSSYRAW
jgi:hypothetical protein